MPGKVKRKGINLGSGKTKKSNTTSFRLFQLFLYFAAIFGFGNKEHTLGLPGADANTVSTNDSRWPNLLIYSNVENNLYINRSLLNNSYTSFIGIENYDGSQLPVQFLLLTPNFNNCFAGSFLSYCELILESSFINDTTAFMLFNNGVSVFNLNATVREYDYIGVYNNLKNPGLISINKNFVFIIDDYGLQIINFSNLTSPTLAGYYNISEIGCGASSSGITPSIFSGQDKIIFFTGSGFCIMNVSNISSPELISIYISSNFTMGLNVNDNLAILPTNTGFELVDITNASLPELIGNYNENLVGADPMIGITSNEDFVFIVGDWGTNQLNIVDISDPKNPKSVGFYTTPGDPMSMSAVGNLLFIADFHSGTEVIDVTSSPTLVANYNPGRGAVSASASIVIFNHGCLLIADNNQGEFCSDLSSISLSMKPVLSDRGIYSIKLIGLSVFDKKETYFRLRVSEQVFSKSKKADESIKIINYGNSFLTTFYMNDLFSFYGVGAFLKITMIDGSPIPKWLNFYSSGITSSWNLPSIAKNSDNSGFSMQVFIDGHTVFLANAMDGLIIIDVSNVLLPRQISSFPREYGQASLARYVSVSNNIVFLSWDDRLQIIDVSNLLNPKLLSTHLEYSLGRTYIKNDLLYIASQFGFSILNISDPNSMTVIGNISLPLYSVPTDIKVDGSLALISDTQDLLILDFSNITSPQITGIFQSVATLTSVVISGKLAYLGGSDGLQIIDFSDPTTPYILSNYSASTSVGMMYMGSSMAISGSVIFLGSNFELLVIDVSDPSKPNLLTTYNLPDNIISISIDGTVLYIANGYSGLSIIDFSSSYYILSGIPNKTVAGNYDFLITGTNDLSVSATSFYTLRVEGAPIANGTMNSQVAFVGQLFNTLVPQGIFIDPNDDALTFSAKLLSSSILPSWLQFSPTGTFLGTPQSSDIGNMTVVVTANDGNGGSASINVQFMVSNLPLVALPISNQLANINQNFIFTVPAGTFVSRDGGTLNYFAKQNNGLPLSGTWLSFNSNTQTFSGIPVSNSRVSIDLSATSTSTGGQVHSYFDIIAEHFPQVQKSIPNVLAAIGIPLDILMPSTLFVDTDGDSMSYRAFVVVNNAPSPLPSWLSFSTFNVEFGEFTGTPPARSTGVLPIQIIATDSQGGQGSAYFNMTLDYFPALNSKYTLSNQVIPVGQAWSFIIPADLFVDQDDSISSLIVSVNSNVNNTFLNSSILNSNTSALSNSSGIANIICSSLIYWMNCQNTTIYGTPDALNVISIVINATDPKGGKTSISFTIAADIYPSVQESIRAQIKSIIAPIGSGFYYQLPQNLFNYSGPGDLSYQANRVANSNRQLHELHSSFFHPWNNQGIKNSQRKALFSNNQNLLPLPNFLSFDPIKQRFSGTPQETDSGNMTIRVTATDVAGGSSSVDIALVITFIPTFKSSIPDLSAKMDRPFSYLFNNASIENKSGRQANLNVEMTNGTSPITNPNWMSFDPTTNIFSMIPNSTGIYHFNLIVDDGVAQSRSPFLISVTQALGPLATSAILQDQSVELEKEFNFPIPSNAFISQDGYPLNFSVQTSDNTVWPSWWIHYSANNYTLTFSGKPTQKEANVLNSWLGGKSHEFLVFATDSYKTAQSSLKIIVNGKSNAELGIQYVGILVPCLSFLLLGYKYRAFLWKHGGKRFYERKEPVGAVINEPFQYSLGKNTTRCVVHKVEGIEEDFNNFFIAYGLNYAGHKSPKIYGQPIEAGEYTIITENKWKVRSELFKLVVDTREELEKQQISIYHEKEKNFDSTKNVSSDKYQSGLFGVTHKQAVKPQSSIDITEIEMNPIGESHEGIPRHEEGQALEL